MDIWTRGRKGRGKGAIEREKARENADDRCRCTKRRKENGGMGGKSVGMEGSTPELKYLR